ncbi:MAG TPA: sigma factor-like helix-turn-helix DNA-binding protein [Cyclobacteriaceae bacterium]|nr:sigma factor-like helix-turn-helix DNA-binding protein [Cyclobacteriaceae bacterium]
MDAAYRKLLTYSYNILGSFEDAKDAVQDVMEKYIHLDKTNIENEVHYLTRMVINHSINLKNKFGKQAAYGVWLPEPVSTETAETHLIREQVAHYTLLVLMETLNAKERAVYLLREAFNYTHEEIAAALDITSDSARQLYSRAKKSLSGYVPTEQSSHRDKLSQYIEAIINGDLNTLEVLLAGDIKFMADGGNKVRIVKDIEIGKEPTAKLVQHVYALFLEGKQYTFTQINHQPAICFWQNKHLSNCQVFSFDDSGKMNFIYSVVDPDKLKSIKFT